MDIYELLTLFSFVGFGVLLGNGVRRCGLAVLPWVVLFIEWFVPSWLRAPWSQPRIGWACLGALALGALGHKAVLSRLSHGPLLNLVLIATLLAHFAFWRWFWYETYFFRFLRGLLESSIIVALAWLGAFLLVDRTRLISQLGRYAPRALRTNLAIGVLFMMSGGLALKGMFLSLGVTGLLAPRVPEWIMMIPAFIAFCGFLASVKADEGAKAAAAFLTLAIFGFFFVPVYHSLPEALFAGVSLGHLSRRRESSSAGIQRLLLPGVLFLTTVLMARSEMSPSVLTLGAVAASYGLVVRLPRSVEDSDHAPPNSA
jgi:hypothetical protein